MGVTDLSTRSVRAEQESLCLWELTEAPHGTLDGKEWVEAESPEEQGEAKGGGHRWENLVASEALGKTGG